MWRPGNNSGRLPISPCNLPNAMIEPVNVTAPTKTPMNVSTAWIVASTPTSE